MVVAQKETLSLKEAKALVLKHKKPITSMIQRRLWLVFNRATRLMEELEEAGVIGPADANYAKVLMTQKNELEKSL